METATIELDARGFEPPQPLMKTLEALGTLPEGATLRLHTRWRPALLYAELAKRGFAGESEEQSDGSCLTYIRRS
ncbi:Hemerythrin (fragment) [Verrucomicrobia bacterium]